MLFQSRIHHTPEQATAFSPNKKFTEFLICCAPIKVSFLREWITQTALPSVHPHNIPHQKHLFAMEGCGWIKLHVFPTWWRLWVAKSVTMLVSTLHFFFLWLVSPVYALEDNVGSISTEWRNIRSLGLQMTQTDWLEARWNWPYWWTAWMEHLPGGSAPRKTN